MENLEFSKVQCNDDVSRIAELIYQTDPYLYRDLLGDITQGTRLLGILIENPRSIFYKDHLYVCRKDGIIVGIASIQPHGTEWDFDTIRMAYMEFGLEITESVRAAGNYFKKTYSRIGIGAFVCNICIHSDYRGQGIGNFVLGNLIAIVGRNNIELSVLADNIAAIKLYQSHGFIIVDEVYEYGGYNQDKVLCYSMIRTADSPK